MNIYVKMARHLNSIWNIFERRTLPGEAPGDHAGMGTPKIMKNLRFGPSFWGRFVSLLHVFATCFFFNVFWTSLMLDFFSQGHRKKSILKHLGHQMQHLFAKYGKVKTAFSLERGHQNQAFQGLCFTEFFGLLARCVETCTSYPSSKASFTLYSIYRPTWPPFWNQICHTFHFLFF